MFRLLAPYITIQLGLCQNLIALYFPNKEPYFWFQILLFPNTNNKDYFRLSLMVGIDFGIDKTDSSINLNINLLFITVGISFNQNLFLKELRSKS
jgi:hypothetical protein